MIKSFKCKAAEKLYHRKFVRKFAGFERAALKRLEILDAAPTLGALAAFPGNRCEALSGDRKGQYSIRINKQWRLCFEWNEGAAEVEIVDYH
ncbi:MAG: type II toxin-antitoxin system RelE/ParE family toxin [Nitrospinaceae bacterium]